jgi:HlyD family secretion protein
MKRSTIYSIGLLMILGLGALCLMIYRGRDAQLRPGVLAQPGQSEPGDIPNSLIAAPGRVEPISEEIHVSAEISGKLQAVLVEEGDQVRRGQLIAQMENGDYRARHFRRGASDSERG